jgi:sugar lactone lactonase YvrE
MALVDGGRTLVVAETLRLQLTAFDVADDGTLGGRRVYAQLAEAFVAPDGICADPDGGVWVANALGPQVLRIADGGQVIDTVTTTQIAYACAIGGDDGRTLFAMTAPSSDPSEVDGKYLARIETATV